MYTGTPASGELRLALDAILVRENVRHDRIAENALS
jgi:hypothetical protein